YPPLPDSCPARNGGDNEYSVLLSVDPVLCNYEGHHENCYDSLPIFANGHHPPKLLQDSVARVLAYVPKIRFPHSQKNSVARHTRRSPLQGLSPPIVYRHF